MKETPMSSGVFPAVSVQLFSHRGHLLPAVRDIVRTKWSRWNVIFSPGRVWSEPGDQGYSRASFPFTLVSKVYGAAHNGLATFLYNDSEISALVVQVVQETDPYDKFNGWGRIAATFTPSHLRTWRAIADDYERELKSRLPVRPWRDLSKAFGPKASEAIHLWPDNDDESVGGLVADGTIFLRRCRTRFGPYPYCDEMRHGVYSIAKSLGALVSMLRLAQKFGDHVFELKIADYLEVTAPHDGWKDVTFAHALNMTTGVGDAPPTHPRISEDGIGRYKIFVYSRSLREKLAEAFAGGNYPWASGEKVRYRSIDTFILAAAMDAYLKSREGPSANLWDMVLDEVLRPIGVMHAPMKHTIEPDGSRGVPILGVGLFPTFHDIAKMSLLLQNDGRFKGQQLLSARKLDMARYRTDARGRPIRKGFFSYYMDSYYMSLWHFSPTLPGCTVNVPNMSGHGGSTVLLLPNDMIAIYLQDGRVGVRQDLAAMAHRLRPLCAESLLRPDSLSNFLLK